MYQGHSVGVVVPAYNERELIGETLTSIPIYVDQIYAVDDGSTDGTCAVIERRQGIDQRIVCLRHERNKGVGAAIITGYQEAIAQGMDIIAVMAGDNQMDPDELPRLLDPIVEGMADYTKGNRLLYQGHRVGMSRWRYFGNTLLTFLTRIGSGYWHLADPQNGYTAISAKVFKRFPPDAIFPWYGYCNDLLVKLNAYGFRVMDIPMPARYGREKSKIRYSTYIPRISWLLLRKFFWRLRVKYLFLQFHPLVLFYLMGILLIPLGLLGCVNALYHYLILGGPLFTRGVLSLLLLAAGTQFLIFGMVFDFMASPAPKTGRTERLDF
ncbi:MAG: glycosyltransferase family 2 protein [Syntrophaceticus sp.]|jgi:glycosyltransferase involved in cell wall biosynthesis